MKKVDVLVYWNAKTSADPRVSQATTEMDIDLDYEQFADCVLGFLKREYGTEEIHELDTIFVDVTDTETGRVVFSDLVCLESSYVLQRWKRYEENLREARLSLSQYLTKKNEE